MYVTQQITHLNELNNAFSFLNSLEFLLITFPLHIINYPVFKELTMLYLWICISKNVLLIFIKFSDSCGA